MTFATTSCVRLWRRTEAWLASFLIVLEIFRNAHFLTATAKFQLAPE